MDVSTVMGVDLSMLSGLAPWILIFGGFVAVSRLLRFFVKGSAGNVLKALGFLGIPVGVLVLVTGVVVWLGHWSGEVWVLLVVTGLGFVLKPLSRVPFSAVLGLVAGVVCAGLLYLYVPLPSSVLGVSSLWIYVAVFLVPALTVFLIFKFGEELAKLFGLLLGSWPVMAVLGVLCMAQGILLLMNQSLLALFT